MITIINCVNTILLLEWRKIQSGSCKFARSTFDNKFPSHETRSSPDPVRVGGRVLHLLVVLLHLLTAWSLVGVAPLTSAVATAAPSNHVLSSLVARHLVLVGEVLEVVGLSQGFQALEVARERLRPQKVVVQGLVRVQSLFGGFFILLENQIYIFISGIFYLFACRKIIINIFYGNKILSI